MSSAVAEKAYRLNFSLLLFFDNNSGQDYIFILSINNKAAE